MDKLVYTAASGLKAHLASQAAIANNMANVSTIGFRADRVVFERLSLQSAGFDTRTSASAEVADADRKPGALQQTGRALDIAIPGDSWLAVQATDGSEAYTRRGDLQIAPSGVLQTGDGFPVIGAGGPITLPPVQSITISNDGTISIVPVGGDPRSPQIIDTLKLASPKGTQTVKGTDNLLHVKGGGVLPADLDTRIESGTLEGSNVNMTQALVDMIENQRAYEVQANLMKSAKELDESSASLMRLPA
ncbi:flagellar basal-body rod protein FlgF [Sphingomonas psychrolutea]|uniref:Flagellar basal-body rod protein FlgF n=1 Tax=Sphingomonas psychrolutea TaxID=1259676 RepID=A0ABQ1GKP8_9SPHN|nr:flagellar basal-body rod protein FlgF [Sphingomonas psychrolutea]GGA45494.1 flagellar basal-body rod protein FlgF [Sphingomonas psychrolutea]